jgi:probable F420-dependent oxidoreductase
MLKLAADRTAGAHPYFVPPEHVAVAREAMGPDAFIGVELAVVIDADPSTARTTARKHTAVYTTLPNYTNNLRQFGYADDDFANAGSDRLVDAIVAWGTLDAIAARVQVMRDAGANHVCIQAMRPDDEVPRADWRELAGALLA